jgi:hypothetical protein
MSPRFAGFGDFVAWALLKNKRRPQMDAAGAQMKVAKMTACVNG